MRRGSSDSICNGHAPKLSFYFELRRRYIELLLSQKNDNFKKRQNLRTYDYKHKKRTASHVRNALTLTANIISTTKLKLGLVEDIRILLVENIGSLQNGRARSLLNFLQT